MIEVISSILLLLGAVLLLIASIGVLRLPDLYTRMQAATKSSAMGLMLILTALCVYYFNLILLVKSILILIFIFATFPIASHMISGVGHMLNIKKWEKTVMDDWEKG
jgi:multicomponent Na+:H+ antiporter subunit G